MTLDPIHIMAVCAVIGLLVVFSAVILSAIFSRKADDNGLVHVYEMRQSKHFGQNGWN